MNEIGSDNSETFPCERYGHRDLSRHASLCMCVFGLACLTHCASLTCARALSFSREPQCAWLQPDGQVLEQGRNGAHNSISRYNLSGSTARCHANHNKSVKLRGLRKAASRLHACAIAHASFFLALLERSAPSTSLFEMYFDKSRRRHVCCNI